MGTGLGLSIAHSIIVQNGGTIDIENRLEGGTEFTVRWPAITQEPTAVEARAAALRPDIAARPRVPIVDEEPHVLTVLKRSLQCNFRTEAVTCGRDAIDRLEQDRDFALIICDLTMPEVRSMDVYRIIQERYPVLASRFSPYPQAAGPPNHNLDPRHEVAIIIIAVAKRPRTCARSSAG